MTIEKVRYKSVELVCFHEAGHAIAAKIAGARVVEMELYAGPPPSGRTRVDRTDNQRKVIALGGFAVERRLWELGRLLLANGAIPTEKQMLSESADNALEDRVSFFGGDHSFGSGQWPKQLDLHFMSSARDLSQTLDMAVVDRLAEALLTELKLDEDRINQIMGHRRCRACRGLNMIVARIRDLANGRSQ